MAKTLLRYWFVLQSVAIGCLIVCGCGTSTEGDAGLRNTAPVDRYIDELRQDVAFRLLTNTSVTIFWRRRVLDDTLERLFGKLIDG